MPTLSPEEINSRFAHHPPSSSVVVQAHERARELCGQLAHRLNELLPLGTRETYAALNAVDKACMYANASIARHMNQQPIDVDDQQPAAAVDLPPGALDAAVAGAARLHAPARTDYGRTVLAYALGALVCGGWLRDTPADHHTPAPYIFDLVDAVVTGRCLDFGDHPVPVSVAGRLVAALSVSAIPPERFAQDPAHTRQHAADVPDYVWSLVDALAGGPLDFHGLPVPQAVMDRLTAPTAAAAIEAGN